MKYTAALRARRRDDETIYQGRCPECGTWQDLDNDQIRGRVSSECANPDCEGRCPFHDNVDWSKLTLESTSP